MICNSSPAMSANGMDCTEFSRISGYTFLPGRDLCNRISPVDRSPICLRIPNSSELPQRSAILPFSKRRSGRLEVAVDHMVSDEDNVSIAYTITGTHKGNFCGILATGKKVKARGRKRTAKAMKN